MNTKVNKKTETATSPSFSNSPLLRRGAGGEEIREAGFREKIVRALLGDAIDCVCQDAYNYLDFNEEESLAREIDFMYNGDIIGSIEYWVYSKCTYHGAGRYDYREPADQDEYDFFYDEILVKINNQNGIELTNLSDEINDRLHKNRYRQLN